MIKRISKDIYKLLLSSILFRQKIIMITSHGKTILDETSVALLDWAEIQEVDLINSSL